MLAGVFSKIEKLFNISMPDLYTIPYEERTKNDVHVFHFDLSDVETFYEQRFHDPWNHRAGNYLMDKLVHGIDISVDTFILIHYTTLVRIPADPERERVIKHNNIKHIIPQEYDDEGFHVVVQEKDDKGNFIYRIPCHPALWIKVVDLHGFLYYQNSPYLPWIKYGFRDGNHTNLSIGNIKEINNYTVESKHKLRVRQEIRDFVRAVYKSFKESRIPRVHRTPHMMALMQFPINVSAAITFINQSTGIRARREEFLEYFSAYYIHGMRRVCLTDRAAVYDMYKDLKDFGNTHFLEGGYIVLNKKDERCRALLDILRIYKNKELNIKNIKEFREYSEKYGAKDEFVLITKDGEREVMTFDYFYDRVSIGDDCRVLTVEEYEGN